MLFGSVASRWARARWLSWLTSSRVGASMIASRPLLRSVCQAEKTSSVRAVRSPTWTASLVEVEAERFGSAVAEGEGCEAFGGVGEPVQLGEPDRSVGVGDVAEHAAGADRGQLLVVTDQPNTAAASDDEVRRRRQG